MPLPILPRKTYLVLVGKNIPLEAHLKKMSSRIGFRFLLAESEADLKESLAKITSLIGVIVCADLVPFKMPSLGSIKPLVVQSSDPIPSILLKLDGYLLKDTPDLLKK